MKADLLIDRMALAAFLGAHCNNAYTGPTRIALVAKELGLLAVQHGRACERVCNDATFANADSALERLESKAADVLSRMGIATLTLEINRDPRGCTLTVASTATGMRFAILT